MDMESNDILCIKKGDTSLCSILEVKSEDGRIIETVHKNHYFA
jgi:hypothetical protein